MTVRQHILPPATTPLERAWDETLPAWGELADAFKTPSEGEPAAFVPWYAAEYGLAEFAPYFDTVPELLAQGLPWIFVRGTAAGVALALQVGVNLANDYSDGVRGTDRDRFRRSGRRGLLGDGGGTRLGHRGGRRGRRQRTAGRIFSGRRLYSLQISTK